MLNNKWVIGLLFTLFASIAFAQTPSTAQVKKVEKLLEISHFDKMIETQKDILVSNFSKQPGFAKYENEFREIFSEIMNVESFKKDIIKVYLNTFTDQEIDEIITFNQSPLGQKILEKLPEINQQLMANITNNINVEKNKKKLEELMVKISLDKINEQS